MKRTAKISKDYYKRVKYHKMDSGQKNDHYVFSDKILDWQVSKVNQRKNIRQDSIDGTTVYQK